MTHHHTARSRTNPHSIIIANIQLSSLISSSHNSCQISLTSLSLYHMSKRVCGFPDRLFIHPFIALYSNMRWYPFH